jgi:hypothetical protein
MTITHVLNRGARLLSVAYVRVGFECCARSGWHWWVGLHELRWATAAPGSNGRRLVPGAGVRGRSTAAGPGGGAAPGGEASVAPPPPILCCPTSVVRARAAGRIAPLLALVLVAGFLGAETGRGRTAHSPVLNVTRRPSFRSPVQGGGGDASPAASARKEKPEPQALAADVSAGPRIRCGERGDARAPGAAFPRMPRVGVGR